MTLTSENVQHAVFKHVGFDVDGRYRPDWHSIKYSFDEAKVLWVDDKPVTVTVADAQFGGEGDFNVETYVVFRVGALDEIKYFRIAGWYQSYEGTEWDNNFYEVKPLEVKVTKWATV